MSGVGGSVVVTGAREEAGVDVLFLLDLDAILVDLSKLPIPCWPVNLFNVGTNVNTKGSQQSWHHGYINNQKVCESKIPLSCRKYLFIPTELRWTPSAKMFVHCLWSRAFSNTLNPSMHTDLSERYSRLWHADYKKTGSTCLVCSLGKSFTTVTLCMVKRTLTVWRNAISFKTTNCVLSSSLSRSLPPKCTTRNFGLWL